MSFLSALLDSTRARVTEARAKVTEDALEQRIVAAEPPRALLDDGSQEVQLIAEIKRATPSRGPLNEDLDVSKMAAAYADGGAAAISVLTEPESFKGSLEDLAAARGAELPLLRKDFILDPFQVLESRAWGADAVLLIVRIVGDELGTLHGLCTSLGMTPLVEIFDENDLERALAVGARTIGINHRDLESFEVDSERTAKLAPRLPRDTTIVSLSGVRTRAEVEELSGAGARAVLVGESVVTAPDPAEKLRELRGAAR